MEIQCEHIKNQNNYPEVLENLKIYNDQCVKCFHQPKDPQGLYLCLKCFNGFCSTHQNQHYDQHMHQIYVQIIQTPKQIQEKYQITKLAIGKQGGAVGGIQYVKSYKAYCMKCKVYFQQMKLFLPKMLILASSDSFSKRQNILSWELQVHPCVHTVILQQKQTNNNFQKCLKCQLKNNLWLCLTCGSTGCGRSNWDGSGGNNHGLQHYESSQHPLVVKLGTITTNGQASMYCYLCDNEVKDDQLANHLLVLGLDIRQQKKTQKTIIQLSIELNLNFSLSLLLEKPNQESQLLYGPGNTGIQNIGNSCYMNSVIQVLYSLNEYHEQYVIKGKQHMNQCTRIPGNCFYCQISKVYTSLESGKYSQRLIRNKVINGVSMQEQYQKSIKPYNYKFLIADKNIEFSTSKQQDAFEYLQLFLDRTEKQEVKYGQKLCQLFYFQSVNKLICQFCKSWKNVSDNQMQWRIPILPPTLFQIQKFTKELEEQKDQAIKKSKSFQDPQYECNLMNCIQLLKIGEQIQFFCSKCGSKTPFQSRRYFKTTPKYLIMTANRFIIQKWVPKKLNALLKIPQELDINDFLLKNVVDVGQQLKQIEEKEDKKGKKSKKYDESMVQALENMGYHRNAAIRALRNKSNKLEEACFYLMQNTGPQLSVPLSDQQQQYTNDISPESMKFIQQMGYTQIQAKIALIKNNHDTAAGINWLLAVDGNINQYTALLDLPEKKKKKQVVKEDNINSSSSCSSQYRLKAVIVHLGKSIHHGHYVAYICKNKKWVLFNDEKVSIPSEALIGKGYIYFYERKELA